MSDCRGWTLLLILMSFLPVITVILVLGTQLGSYSAAFKQSRADMQAYYAAEAGIERYKNEIKSDPAYAGTLTFTKTIDGTDYNIQTTSVRFGAPEQIRITSTVTGTNITVERVISTSRFV